MKIVCINSIYDFEAGKEYSIEHISNYIIGNLQVFIQNYFSVSLSLDVNIINAFLVNFKMENN